MARSQNIAIIGAGLAGLACCWNALQRGDRVTLWDRIGIGAGASGAAAGLLHAFPGRRCRLHPKGGDGMRATAQLLKIAQQQVDRDVVLARGLLRVARDEEQAREFERSAREFEGIELWDRQQILSYHPDLQGQTALWIEQALTIDTPLYLQGLWSACESMGAALEIGTLEGSEDPRLTAYDQVIWTAGIGNREVLDTALNPVRGQAITFDWPDTLVPFSSSLMAKAYVVPAAPGRCTVGGTFERGDDNPVPDEQRAIELLLPQLQELFPAISELRNPVVHCGVRAATPNHQPLTAQLTEKQWVIAGLGSKGLLWHAVLAQQVIEGIAE